MKSLVEGGRAQSAHERWRARALRCPARSLSLVVRRQGMRRWIGFTIAGTVVGLVAGLFSLMAAGAGHGTYVPTAILFPFSIILASLGGAISTSSLPFIVGFLQFPIYGYVLSRPSWPRVLSMVVAHGAAAAFAWIREMEAVLSS